MSSATTDDAGDHGVKPLLREVGGRRRFRSITMALVLVTLSLVDPAAAAAQAARHEDERPPPSLKQQLESLERQGATSPQSERRLRDELRRMPPSSVQRRSQRTLDRLPAEQRGGRAAPPVDAVPTAPDLPSSLPPTRLQGSGEGR